MIGNVPGTQQAATDGGRPRDGRAGAVSRHTPRSPLTIGLIALAIILVGDVPRLHEGHPVHARRFRVKATFESANSIRVDSPVRIAGVNVGKVETVEAEEGTDHVGRDAGDQEAGAADPRGRDGQDPPAHLPRGQLLRRPAPGHARPRPSSTTAASIKVTQHGLARAARRGAHRRCRPTPARTSRTCSTGSRTALNSKPTAADDRDADPVGARRDRRRVLQRRLRRHPGRRALDGPGLRGASSARSPARDLSRLIDGTARTDRRADPQRGASSRT